MYLTPEDGKYGCNTEHVLNGLIKFVVVDGNMNVNFFRSVICIRPMCTNYTLYNGPLCGH